MVRNIPIEYHRRQYDLEQHLRLDLEEDIQAISPRQVCPNRPRLMTVWSLGKQKKAGPDVRGQ